MALHPFLLVEPFAAGGMGEIWRGEHRRTGRPVAIKVITGREARKPEAQEQFRAEARAAAGLDHPGVAWVLDYGLLPEAWEERSGGRLSVGSPYLVSEHARGGDLRRWVRMPPSWPTLRQALLSLLDALAFAHARGVIHRDIKPSNVLIGTRREERQGVLLADFGIAHRLGTLPEPGFQPRAGTPTFMAPEQIAGDWRAYGPWTDLYALGVLTWTIVQAVDTFAEAPTGAAGRLMRWGPTRVEVPPRLSDWLSRMLCLDPQDRFQRAADASAALERLSDDPAARWMVDWEPQPDADEPEGSWRTPGFVADTTAHHLLGVASNQTQVADPGDVLPLQLEVEPMSLEGPRAPADWRPARSQEPPLALVDVGTGLYGPRERPLVGREPERDHLWRRLIVAHDEGRAQVLLLSGALGCGKSRLLRWLCERSDAVGLAFVCQGRLGEGPDAGLLPLLRRMLRVEGLGGEGLGGEALAQHLARSPVCAALQPEDRHALRELLGQEAGAARATKTEGERYALLLRVLRRLAGGRVLLLALDDAAEDPDGLGLARHLLGQEEAGPVVLALAARDEALASSPALGPQWRALAERPEVEALPLGPLPQELWTRLAGAGLRLSPALAERVAARSAGNPLFAELIVGAWVSAGELVAGPAGFELDPGAAVALPESVSGLVQAQVDALLAARGAEDLEALEVAATLGLEVDRGEWSAATAALGVRPAPDLIDACMGRRLLRAGSSEHSFVFSQNMLREALLQRAAAAGRSVAHHRAAARALEDGALGWEGLGRLGRHRLAAGEALAAVEPLLDAAHGASLNGCHAEERALLDLAERALPALPPDRQDLAAARLWALRGHTLQFGLGDRAEARACYARAVDAATRAGRPALVLDTRRRLGGACFELGEVATAQAILRDTLRQAQELGDAFVQSLTALDLCTILRHAGLREEAAEMGRFSQRIATEAGLLDLIAINSKHSWFLETLPSDEAREKALIAAIAELARLNVQGHRAAALNVLGVLEQRRGALAEAMAHFRASLRVYDEIGSSYASLPRYNMARILKEQGRIWDAYPLLKRSLEEVQTHRWVGLEPMVRSALALLALHANDLVAFDAHLARVEALWRAGGTPERDAASNLENVARLASQLGQRERAAAAAALAGALYEAAGAPEDAARCAEAAG